MERRWSDEARSALDAYPWKSPADRERAVREAEMVSFGESVETADLPLAVRRWAAKRCRQRYVWNGESWRELVDGFERAILEQAMAKANGSVSVAARLLKTTPRIVSYKAKKHGVK